MAVSRGEVWFAPGIRMVDLNFDDPVSLVGAFHERIRGFFLGPVQLLQKSEPPESGLFVGALSCAAAVEAIASVDPKFRGRDALIASWLEAHVPAFRERIGDTTLAQIFERRYRHHLAHKAYVSLGRLGDIDGAVSSDSGVVTVNPFLLAREVESVLLQLVADVREGRRDPQAFAYSLRELFEPEVRQAKAEETASA